MSETFGQVVVCDFEYETAALPQRDGDLPNVLCMVAYVLNENLQHVHTIRLWRGDFGKYSTSVLTPFSPHIPAGPK
jgi:hypothetical protein